MIRQGRDDDAAGFIALIGGCWAEYPGVVFDVDAELPEIRALASYVAGKGGALWTAEQDGQVVGMVVALPGDGAWQLSRMYVAATQRGTGLAADLLRRAEDHARAAGGVQLALWSDMLFTRAHAFYEKHGYVRRGGLRALQDLSNSIEAAFAKPLAGLVVETLDVAAAESAERRLAAILRDCVHGGASVSFVPPLPQDKALAYWRGITRAVGEGRAALLVAWLDGALVGTVQLGLDMPDNQRHRADLRKMLVSPSARRRGLGAALLRAAEQAAVSAGRELLVLDTWTASAGPALYAAHGWRPAGVIPGYSRDENGADQDTQFFYKRVQRPAA